jgi:nucleotide-binding universal stress UspA family protein
VKGKPVLVAVDGSPASDAAVGAAVELAGALGSPVRFVHASSPLAERLFDADNENGPTEQQIVAGDPVLAGALGRARDAGVQAEVEVVGADGDTGDLAAVIAGIASGSDAGVIVCGSRGRGAVAGAVLGSVSHNLIRYAPVPVLVVHAAE